MAKTIESWTITVGTTTFNSGWATVPLIGSGFGSISQGTSDFFGGNALNGIYHIGGNSNQLYFAVFGNFWENSGWDTLIVNGNSYSRSSATFIQRANTSSLNSPETSWVWSTSNPFGSSGASNTVNLQHSGATPCDYDSISLNEIHQQAGGSSGTSVTINDADVRGVSWFGNQHGSTPASGATQDFADFYFPRWAGAVWTYRPNSTSTSSATGTASSQHWCCAGRDTSTVYAAAPNTATATADNAWIDLAIRTDSTNNRTYIEVADYQPGNREMYEPDGDQVDTLYNYSSPVVWTVVGYINEQFDLVNLYTTTEDTNSYTYEDPDAGELNITATYQNDNNLAPQSGVTHISTNSTSHYQSLTAGTRYGRRVRAYAQSSANFEDTDVGFTLQGIAEGRAVFRHKMTFVKYPTDEPTNIKKQVVEVSVWSFAKAVAETD